MDDLLLLGETPPIHPPATSANDLLSSVGPLEDLNYAAPIGASLEDDAFASRPIMDDDNFAAPVASNSVELGLHVVPSLAHPALAQHLDVFSPVLISDDRTLLSMVTDDLHTHTEPAIGMMLSFEATPLEGEQGASGDPPVGRLVSFDPETSAVGQMQEGDETNEREMESSVSKPCFDGPTAIVGGVVRIERTRHASVRDEDGKEEESSLRLTSTVKKSKSLRTPVRPAPPVPSHLREKPLGGAQNLSPAPMVVGAEPSNGTRNHASLSTSSSNENVCTTVNNEEMADDLGMIKQRMRSSAIHFDSMKGHGRSASLDLNKIFMKEEG